MSVYVMEYCIWVSICI